MRRVARCQGCHERGRQLGGLTSSQKSKFYCRRKEKVMTGRTMMVLAGIGKGAFHGNAGRRLCLADR
jgi:hypothetical protein